MLRQMPASSRGFSLIEALVAWAIVGFGLLAIAKLQMTFVTNADHAKQRSEAVRLGEERIEQLRSFEQLSTALNRFAYQDIVTGSDTVSGYASNASYTRNWTVTDSSSAAFKTIALSTSWQDRQGATQTVSFQSTIARLDPKASASLKFPAAGSPVKKPKDRDLNVPVPAVALAGGKSGFTPPGAAGFYYVFDNTTGIVTNLCNGALPSAGAEGCSDNPTVSLVISGYVNFNLSNSPCSDLGASGCAPGARMDVDFLIAPACPQGGSSCAYPNLPGRAAPYQCSDDGALASRNGSYSQSGTTVTVSATAHGLSPGMQISLKFTSGALDGYDNIYPVVTAPTANTFTVEVGSSGTGSGNVSTSDPYVTAYTCVVSALDLGAGQTPRYVWAGRVNLSNTIGTGIIGAGESDFKVCRYSADYNANGKTDNVEHPASYGLLGSGDPGYMSESVENQNFLVVKGNKACPVDPGAATLQHQP